MAMGFSVDPDGGEVQLADSQVVALPGRVELTIKIGDRCFTHPFRVMPTLRNAVLIGMDLWGKLGYAIPPPPLTPTTTDLATTAATEGLTQGSEEERLGCTIQRSDLQQQQKKGWLTAKPPPPPARKRPREEPKPEPPEPRPLRPMGPLPPPPVPVEVEKGHIVEVPHFSAHVAREYKTRSRGSRWHIRFNGEGSVRSVRKL
ncbi:hypothetical protein ALC62_07211 [Cyphomyrmex costatus]|uniref:Uncharacterized protein n=1 Tax=Cyphomyrmex costatus TaxID=456900 RepID=A0A151IHX0_9HYME|nr:hypothetical protein ALC62_07211 [Cyphomyrmex costatus]